MTLNHPRLIAVALALMSGFACAQTLGVRIEARCPDKTLDYMIGQQIASTMSASKTHALVQDGSASVHIRFIAAPVRPLGEDKKPPLGVALAVLAMKKSSTGAWEVIRFSNAFLPLDKLEDSVSEAVLESLK